MLPKTKSQLLNYLANGANSKHGLGAAKPVQSNDDTWFLYNDTGLISKIDSQSQMSIWLDDLHDQGQILIGKKIQIGYQQIIRYNYLGQGDIEY